MTLLRPAVSVLLFASVLHAQQRVDAVKADGTKVHVLTAKELADHALSLEWFDGEPVEWDAEGPSFEGRVPRAVLDLLPGSDTMKLAWGDRDVVVAWNPIVATKTDDGKRWVLADELAGPTSVPAEPGTIDVPRTAPPVPAPSDGGSAGRPEPAPGSSQAVNAVLAFIKEKSTSGLATAKGPLSEAVKDALDRPETVNAVLSELMVDGHGLRFLRDVDWRLKTFEVDGESSLGAEFKYEAHEPFSMRDHSDGRGVTGFGCDFIAEGNVAFENDVNPADFISARLALDYFSSNGGSKGPLSPEEQQRAVDLAFASAKHTDRDAWLRSPEWSRLKELARGVLDTQVYWELGLDATFESDQEWDAKNYAFGAHGALDVKAWDDQSEAAHLNLFDYPAAFLRYLSGYDRDFTVRGSSIPTLVLGLDHIEPEGDTPRSDVGDDSSYDRVRLELVYKSPLAIIAEQEYALVAQYRRFYELSPSDAVEDADLDQFGFLLLAIESDAGLFASYTKGQLPFDDGDTTTYAIGWRLHL